MSAVAPLWLASRSPRRRRMLAEAGIDAVPRPASVEDGGLRPGAVPPAWWVTALAYLKARSAADELAAEGHRAGLVLGADTVCVVGGRVEGQPRDAADARRLLEAMRGGRHVVLTGVCVLALGAALDGLRHRWLVDAAAVRWGDPGDAAITAYVDSGDWQGKAGAYNLSERVAAGWPIECDGDPGTVMGLPMRRLRELVPGRDP